MAISSTSSGGGGSSTSSSPGSTSTSTTKSDASASTSTSSSPESTSSSSNESSGSSSVTEPKQTPDVGSATELHSGEPAASAPEEAAAFTAVQAEAAEEVAGEAPPEDPQVQEYEELRAFIEEYATQPAPEDPAEMMTREMQFSEASIKIADMVNQTGLDYQNRLEALQTTLEDYQEQASFAQTAQITVVPAMTDAQAADFSAFSEAELEKKAAPLEQQTQEFLAHLDSPLTQAVFRDLDPQRQTEIIGDMAGVLGFSEAGRERLASFVDGLAGQGDDTMAELAAELRSELSGSNLDTLDNSLGLIAGIDQQARPQGAEQRLDAIRDDLEIPADSRFNNAREIGFDAFAFVADNALGITQKGVEDGAGMLAKVPGLADDTAGMLSGLSRLAKRAGGALSAFEAVDRLGQGDLLGAGAAAAAVVSAVTTVPRVANWAGAISLGLTGIQMIHDATAYDRFLRAGLEQSMAGDPLAQVLEGASARRLSDLQLNPDQPLRDQLIQRVEGEFGPQWEQLTAGGILYEFWTRALT